MKKERNRTDIRKQARKSARKKASAYVDQLTTEEQSWLLGYQSPRIERLGIPEYNWWNEALHGVARAGTATVFPAPIALAATPAESAAMALNTGCDVNCGSCWDGRAVREAAGDILRKRLPDS